MQLFSPKKKHILLPHTSKRTVRVHWLEWKKTTSLFIYVIFFCTEQESFSQWTSIMLHVFVWSKIKHRYFYPVSSITTVRVPERVRFRYENVLLSTNHSSSWKKSWAVIGWEVYIFMPKSYTFRNFDGTGEVFNYSHVGIWYKWFIVVHSRPAL